MVHVATPNLLRISGVLKCKNSLFSSRVGQRVHFALGFTEQVSNCSRSIRISAKAKHTEGNKCECDDVCRTESNS